MLLCSSVGSLIIQTVQILLLALWAPVFMVSCTVGFPSLTFYDTLECRCRDLVWPEHTMAFLLLWHADITPFTELPPHKTLKHHDQQASASSALCASERDPGRTQITGSAKPKQQIRQIDVLQQVNMIVCAREQERRDTTGQILFVCSLEFSGEPCGTLSYTSHK